MKFAPLLTRLAKDNTASAAILFCASLPPLIGAAAVSVDLASLFLAERQLQGIADSAAMAATSGDIEKDGLAQAQAIVDRTGVTDITIYKLTPGVYRQDRSIDFDDRFAATDTDPSAASVELRRDVPLFFAKAFMPNDFSSVSAKSVSSRTDLAAFSIGSRLAELSGGIENQLLSGLVGTDLGLKLMDYQGLASAQIDLLGYADALKAKIDNGGNLSYAEVFGSEVPLTDAVDALADATSDTATADTLRSISGKLGDQKIRVGDMVDLGPMGGEGTHADESGLQVDAYSLLRAMLQLSQGDSYSINLNLSVAGLGNVAVRVVGGSPMQHSPWLTVTSAKDYVIRTSQARVYVDVQVAGSGKGAISLHLPIYLELAEAEARLSDIECKGDKFNDGVTLEVTPSVGTVAIANADTKSFDDLSSTVDLTPATLTSVSLLKVTGFSEVDLGGVHAQPVHFGPEEISGGVTKTVSTNDLAEAIVTSLAKDLELKVQVSGLSLSTKGLTDQVTAKIAGIAPSLDALINELTEAIGVKVGAADVRVDKYSCGTPQVVA